MARKSVRLFIIAIMLGVVSSQTLLWDDCKRPGPRHKLDLMVALAVSPVEDKFPYSLFQVSRMPDAVTQFMKALLPVFDYLHTRVSVVGLDRTFNRITPFINNRYRILRTFERWEPTVSRGVTPSDMRSIRAVFQRDARPDVVKVLILVVDQPPEDISVMTTESRLLEADGVFVLIIGFSKASRYGDQLRQLTSGQKELITIASAYHLPTRVRPVKNALCDVLAMSVTTAAPAKTTTADTPTTTAELVTTTAKPPTTTTEATTTTDPTTTAEMLTTTSYVTTTTDPPDGVYEEVMVLADDSESTRDFTNMSSHYSHHFVQFLQHLVNRTAFDHCKLGLALFSSDVRIVGDLSSNKSQLLMNMDSLNSSQQGFSGTNLTRAVQEIASRLTLTRPRKRKTIVIVTDGQPNDLQMTSTAITQEREGIPELRIFWVLSPLFDGTVAYRKSDYDQLAVSGTDMTFTVASREKLTSLSLDGLLCTQRSKSS